MTTTVVIGIIAIIVAFALLIVLCFRGMSAMYVAPLCALVVAVACGLPLVDTMVNTFAGGAGGFVIGLLPVFLMSILIGRIYIASGAATNIAVTLMNAFAKNASVKRRQTVGVIISIAVSWAMCFGGIDTFCALFTLFPVILTVCGEANIPRKYMIGMITCGVSGAACTPGAPLVANSIPMGILGTSSLAGAVPGFIGAAIVLVGGGVYLVTSIHRATDRGEVFEPGKVAFAPVDPDRKYPPFVVALLPLVLVVVLFNITNNLAPSLLAGFVLALVVLTPFIKPEEGLGKGRTLINTLNEGGKSTAEALLLGGIVAGFAAVVQATDAYNFLIEGVTHLNIPAPLLVVIAVAILVGLTGSPPVALQIVVPVLAATVALEPEAIHRIATITASTFDTLPYQGAIIIMLGMADLKHRDGYPPVMMCTVIMTGLASVVAALLFATGLF